MPMNLAFWRFSHRMHLSPLVDKSGWRANRGNRLRKETRADSSIVSAVVAFG